MDWFEYFDTPVARGNTGCAKYDRPNPRIVDEDLISMWVADMDFRIPPAAIEALHARVDHGIFGYTDPTPSYFEAMRGWMKRHHGPDAAPESVVITPGVVYALAQAVQAFTAPGDGVLIQPPVYYPFKSVVEDNGRRLVRVPLRYDAQAARARFQEAAGSAAELLGLGADVRAVEEETAGAVGSPSSSAYGIDFDAFERAVVDNDVKLFILCNPHNPVGRVWRREELERMGRICLEHGVIVVSDEIHADFARPGFEHVSFASLDPEIVAHAIVATAPTKTFNLAGLQVSNIIVPDEGLRSRYRATVEASGYDNINVLGMCAARACFETGDDWLAGCKDYLEGNLALMNAFVAAELPGVCVVQPESTYLVWVDCNGLGLTHGELRDAVEKDARVWLDHGAMFGPEGRGFLRFNIATQRANLEKALIRLKDAFSRRVRHRIEL